MNTLRQPIENRPNAWDTSSAMVTEPDHLVPQSCASCRQMPELPGEILMNKKELLGDCT